MPISGLRYVPDYLDRTAHDRLVAAVDAEPWLASTGHRVQIYGYRYRHADHAVFRIGGLPAWARELAQRLHRDGLLPGVADQMVANEYEPGQGIFAHVDQPVFGEAVASVSLGSSCVMQFSGIGTGTLAETLLEPRSVLVLSGESRWAWLHGIPARHADRWQDHDFLRSRRVSLTFRLVPPAC
jgi:alkylated DNA repair dioxygenase AlkB